MEDQPGLGSHAEMGRVSGCPQREEKTMMRTEHTPPTRAKTEGVWHFPGALRNEGRRDRRSKQEPAQAVRPGWCLF